MQPYSIYIHIPFCQKRCNYCDFNTFTGLEALIQPYVEALVKEIGLVSKAASEKIPVHTLFFGGGTPSLLTLKQFDKIFPALALGFDLLPESEVSLEANPGTVNLEKLSGLRNMGFNRISLGVQSLIPSELALLGRIHDEGEVYQAFEWARQAGFDQINLDLILGLPEQTMTNWQTTVEKALALNPEHLSVYALTIETGTPFGSWIDRGILSMPDEDASADQYEWTRERLLRAGYLQYEISNWARRGLTPGQNECKHNLQYWNTLPYLGFGTGAVGYSNKMRIANVNQPGEYIRACQKSTIIEFPVGPAAGEVTAINLWTEIQETMMVGLRLTEQGVRKFDFYNRFGVSIDDVFGKEINQLTRAGLLENHTDKIKLSSRGVLLGNQVFMQFVGLPDEAAPEEIRNRL